MRKSNNKKITFTISMFFILLCFNILILSQNIQAAATYNSSNALSYAQSHWNDGVGLCAQFVSECLKAGGCSAYSTSASALFRQLQNSGMGQAYEITLGSGRSIYMPNYSGKIAAGDPVFYYCSGCTDGKPYIHTVLCNGSDSNGYMKAYSHNNANSGTSKYTYSSSCYACGTAITKAYVYHFTSNQLPKGYVDVRGVYGGEGCINIEGWAFDYDVPTKNLEVHVYIGGPAGSPNAQGFSVIANKYRPDVHTAYWKGEYHGFEETIFTSKRGWQPVYFYAIDGNAEGNEWLDSDVGKVVDVYIKQPNAINFPSKTFTVNEGETKTLAFDFQGEGIHSLSVKSFSYISMSWKKTDWAAKHAEINIQGLIPGKTNLDVCFVDSNNNEFFKDSIEIVVNHVHKYTTSKVTKAPTCSSTGVRSYVCSCGAVSPTTETIAKTAHSYSTSYTVDRQATCQTDGSKSRHCLYCNAKTDVTTIAKTGHSGGTATCTSQAKCVTCGTSYGSVGSHSYSSSWTVDKQATCQAEGSKSRHCAYCELKIDVTTIPKTSHSGGTATCTSQAKCAICGTSYGSLGSHSYSSNWTVDKQANCQTEGAKSRHCLHCSAKTDMTLIPKTSHSGGTATCTSQARCSTCGISYGSYGSHTYSSNWIIDIQPTCTSTGSKSQHCVTCGIHGNVVHIPATAHNWLSNGVCSTCGTRNSSNNSTQSNGYVFELGEVIEVNGVEYVITKLSRTRNCVEASGCVNENKKSIVIPGNVTYKGKKFSITEIDDDAFGEMAKLKKVTIGVNVTKIGNRAFENCENLRDITIKSKNLKKVGKSAFKGIDKEAVVKVPKKKLKKYKMLLKGKGNFRKIK